MGIFREFYPPEKLKKTIADMLGKHMKEYTKEEIADIRQFVEELLK